MTLLHQIIGLLLLGLSPTFATNILACNISNNHASHAGHGNINQTIQGIVNVIYERNDLAIYTHNFTEFVNFLIFDFKIEFNGTFVESNQTTNNTLSLSLKTDLEGLGFLSNDTEAPLSKCKINLENNLKYREDIPMDIQKLIIQSVNSCIQPKLCNQLGSPKQDDFLQAQISPHEFNNNSAVCKALSAKYPNLYKEKKYENNSIQSTINAFADFWIASAISMIPHKSVGYISLPDVNQTLNKTSFYNGGHFRFYNGTFGDLKMVKRSHDVVLINKGVHFSIETGFHLPEAHFHFDQISMKYGLISSNGKLDITIHGLKFYLKVEMNYNTSPCELKIGHLYSKFGEVSFKLSESNLFQGIISDVLDVFVNDYVYKNVEYIETQLRELMNAPLSRFECERFRP